MEYSVVEGKKSNSVNYISEGYRYVKYHENNGTIYLRCTLAKQKGCLSLAKIYTPENLLKMTKNHSHSQCDYGIDSIILTNRIKRAAELSTDNLREVFNIECRDSQEGSFLTLKKLESTLVKRRRLQLPKLPSTPEDLDELLLNSPYSSNHRVTIREGNEVAVIFASDLSLAKLKEAETIHFDATFKVVPRLLYELLLFL